MPKNYRKKKYMRTKSYPKAPSFVHGIVLFVAIGVGFICAFGMLSEKQNEMIIPAGVLGYRSLSFMWMLLPLSFLSVSIFIMYFRYKLRTYCSTSNGKRVKNLLIFLAVLMLTCIPWGLNFYSRTQVTETKLQQYNGLNQVIREYPLSQAENYTVMIHRSSRRNASYHIHFDINFKNWGIEIMAFSSVSDMIKLHDGLKGVPKNVQGMEYYDRLVAYHEYTTEEQLMLMGILLD